MNNAMGMATSREGIESKVITDAFICLDKKTKKP
jgi:hypothetical protein